MNPQPKSKYLRSESYRRWTAAQPCAHCRVQGYSQAAHSDDNGAGGKGLGLKACDSTIYPACGPHPVGGGLLTPGCHWTIGSSGHFTKRERRELEAKYAELNRQSFKARAACQR